MTPLSIRISRLEKHRPPTYGRFVIFHGEGEPNTQETDALLEAAHFPPNRAQDLWLKEEDRAPNPRAPLSIVEVIDCTMSHEDWVRELSS